MFSLCVMLPLYILYKECYDTNIPKLMFVDCGVEWVVASLDLEEG